MNLKKLLSIILVFTILLLEACVPDIGDFENDDDYIDSFDISWIDGNNSSVSSYDLADFYFPDLQHELTSPMSNSTEMKYLYIKARKTLNIEDMAFYLKSTKGGVLDINVYIASHTPNHLAFRDLDDEYDKIKNNIVIVPSLYTDPKENQITRVRFELSKNTWDSRLFRIFKTIEAGDYLIFQFVQNVDIFYEPEDDSLEAMEELIGIRNENRVDLFLTGIFIRAVN